MCCCRWPKRGEGADKMMRQAGLHYNSSCNITHLGGVKQGFGQGIVKGIGSWLIGWDVGRQETPPVSEATKAPFLFSSPARTAFAPSYCLPHYWQYINNISYPSALCRRCSQQRRAGWLAGAHASHWRAVLRALICLVAKREGSTLHIPPCQEGGKRAVLVVLVVGGSAAPPGVHLCLLHAPHRTEALLYIHTQGLGFRAKTRRGWAAQCVCSALAEL